MKKKTFLVPLISVNMIGTTLSPLVGCSSTPIYFNEASTLRLTALDQFFNFIKIPHPTFGTRRICDYFKTFLKEQGYEEIIGSDQLPDGKYFYEDNYRAITEDVSSGNLIFNIPAAEGCEDWQGVTLQGHMDMVAVGFPVGEELNVGVDPIMDGEYIHSKDFKTSLGADCGAGLSLILALTKHSNIVKHGPIRCIFTADEEDGISGASTIKATDIKYPYLINIDWEDLNSICVSAAGTLLIETSSDFENGEIVNLQGTESQYEIDISGLSGGHSANQINNNIPNAIMMGKDIMQNFDDDNAFQIVSFKTHESVNNTIPNHVTFRIVTSASEEFISYLISSKEDAYRKMYPQQTDLKLTYQKVQSSSSDKALLNEPSKKILGFLSHCLYGPISWLDEDKKEVATSANVGPFNIDLNQTGVDEHKMMIQMLCRSCHSESLVGLVEYYEEKWETYLNEISILTVGEESPTWEAKSNNKLRDMYLASSDLMKTDVKTINSHGWLECGYFYSVMDKSQKPISMISIGSKIENAHSVKEGWHTNTFLDMIRLLLYCLEHVNELTN